MFQSDLKFGEAYQHLLKELVEHDLCSMSKGNFKEWDVKMTKDGFDLTFEVKADRLATKTGNMAIEIACSGKPSGLTASKADYWAYFIHGTRDWYMMDTEELRDMLKAKKYREVNGGDGWRSRMVLVPLKDLEAFRQTYDEKFVLKM